MTLRYGYVTRYFTLSVVKRDAGTDRLAGHGTASLSVRGLSEKPVSLDASMTIDKLSRLSITQSQNMLQL